jgi:CheY-like chemotaxis protein
MDVDRQKVKPPAAPVLLVHGADASVAALLRRYLPGFELTLLDEGVDLSSAVELHHPAAILWNSPPDAAPVQPPDLPVAAPFLQCSIPNLAWLADSLDVQACLSKPVDPQKLVREIRKNANARDILMIDDDRGFIQLVERELQAYLPNQTFAIRRAYDGRQGLQSMLDQPPDLVLLDLYMPEMNGYQVIEAMKANPALRGLPVLVLTANNYPDTGSEFEASQLCISRQGGLRVVDVVNYLAAVMGVIKNTRQPAEPGLP